MKSFAARATAEKADAPTAPKGVAMVDNRAVAVAQRQAQAAIDNSLPQVAQRKNTTGLPDKLKAGVESLSGHSLDDVKVHYNSAKPAQLQALAYAQGTDIHVAPGQEKHLPHEAWHVAQQKQGRVRATTQLKGGGVAINDSTALEHEADLMGSKALAVAPATRMHVAQAVALQRQVVQMVRETAEANWTVMQTYNNGSAAQEVLDAFQKADYVQDEALMDRIVELMDANKYGEKKFAHGTGTNHASKKQGKTDPLIQACKDFLIGWANANPRTQTGKKSKNKKGERGKKEEDF